MTMNKRDPRTYMHFFSMILKTNEEMLLNIHVHVFFFRDKCVVNYHMVRGNCQG